MSCPNCNCKDCLKVKKPPCIHLEWKRFDDHDPCGKTDRGYRCEDCGKELSVSGYQEFISTATTSDIPVFKEWRQKYAERIKNKEAQ